GGTVVPRMARKSRSRQARFAVFAPMIAIRSSGHGQQNGAGPQWTSPVRWYCVSASRAAAAPVHQQHQRAAAEQQAADAERNRGVDTGVGELAATGGGTAGRARHGGGRGGGRLGPARGRLR